MTIKLTDPDNTVITSISDVAELKPKELARVLKRRGIDEKAVGGARIYDALVVKYGAAHPDMPSLIRPNAIRQVNRWIAGTEYEGLDVSYDAKVIKSDIRSFAGRLDLVKSVFFNGEKLTTRQVRHVVRVLDEFQDPFGEHIDLIAQFAIVWELSEREAMRKESADIETMFAFAPWRDKANSDLYLLAVEKSITNSAPVLRLISPVIQHKETVRILEYMIGAYAQLGLPWFIGWIQERPGHPQRMVFNYRLDDSEMPMTIEHWKPKCNWKQLVEARLTGQPTQRVTLNIDRGETGND